MPSRELIYRVTVATGNGKRQARALRSAIESELRQIKVGAIDTSTFQRATGEVQRLRQELQATAQAASQVKMPSFNIPGASGGGGLGNVLGLAGGVAGITLAVRQLQQLGQEVVELGRRGAVFSQLKDVLNTYAASVGQNADRMIAAATKASQGTISQYELVLNANRAIQFQVATTAEQYAKLVELSTALGRAQGISDTQALEFITTGIARESRLILDNLGLIINIKDAQAQYAREVGKSTDQLTQAERKAALLNEAYRQGAVAIEANRDAADSAATIFERFDATVQNAKDSLGEMFAEMSKDYVSAFTDQIAQISNYMLVLGKGTAASTGEVETYLTNLISQAKTVREAYAAAGKPPDASAITDGQAIAAREFIDAITEVGKAIEAGIPGADKYEAQIKQLALALIEGTMDAPTAVSTLMKVNAELAALVSNPQMQAAGAEAKRIADEKAASMERLKLLAESEEGVNKALLSRAQKAVETLGADQAISLYKQAKAQAEAALQELQNSSTTNADEIAIRVEEVITNLTASMDAVEEAAANAIDFNSVVTGFQELSFGLEGIDAGFTDFLPGVASVREELISLSTELAFTGQMTEEQADALNYYNGVASATADDTSLLGQVTAELGDNFLASNEYAAALVDQLYQAEGAYRANLISSDVYAGILAVLSGRLLTVAQAAGVATGAINALNAAQGGRASAQGIVIGGQVADRVQLQQAARERAANRKEQERLAKEQERAAKRAATEQERGAKRAAKAMEDGARKANQELEALLKKVPGLFGTTQVTEDDMRKTKLGTYINKADEYLRRLRDEVKNGTDWADVSIEDAKAALERVGIKAGDSAEAILDQFEEAWADSSLFSDKANLSFIDKEAVQIQQDLAEKAKQGEKNILEYFGVVVDEAVDTVTGGSGGGGAADIDIAPADFQTSAALVEESIKSGADDALRKSALSIKESLARNTGGKGFFDPTVLFGPTGSEKSVMGPLPKEITITADASAKPIADFLAAGASAAQGNLITQALPSLQPTLPADTGEKLALDLGDQLGKQVDIFLSHGSTIGKALLIGLSQSLSVDANGKAQVDIAGFIGNNLNAQVKTFVAQGSGIAGLLKQGVDEGLSLDAEGGAQVNIAAFLADNLSAQGKTFIAQGGGIADLLKQGIDEGLAVNAEGNAAIDFGAFIGNNLNVYAKTFIAQGRGIASLLQQGLDEVVKPAQQEGQQAGIAVKIASLTLAEGVRAPDVSVLGKLDKFAIDQTALLNAKLSVPIELKIPQQQTNTDGSAGANAITPLITDINTQIRTKQKEIGAQGITIAQIVMAAIVAHFKGTQTEGGGGGEGQSATPLADAMLTAVSTQFSTTQNMFYAAGFLPASAVESGFKGYAYTGLAESFRDALTNGIRSVGPDLAQRGGTMASYVQGGFVTAFNSEAFKTQLVAVGELMYTYIEMGILAKVNGGKLTEAIGAQVIEDLNAELEQP